MNYFKFFLVAILLGLFSCNENRFSISREGNTDFSELNILRNKKPLLRIGLKAEKEAYFVSRKINDFRWLFLFFYDDGTLHSKETRDSLNRRQGKVYFFYKGTGCLSGDFSYVDGLYHGYGFKYYCEYVSSIEEEHLYIHDELIYVAHYDIDGNLLYIEGTPPDNMDSYPELMDPPVNKKIKLNQ
jgi:hypothetical protein